MKSRVVTVAGTDAVPVLTSVEAEFTDVFTTLFSTTEALTGMYGLLQRGALFAGGMMLQSKRMGGGLNVFTSGA